MREIEFRGKLTNNRGWAYGNLSIKPNNECAIITPNDTVIGKYGKVDIETVGQYTGLKDKNGTKIFEGDILNVETELFGSQKFIVRYNYGSFRLMSLNERVCCVIEHFDMEVIGNIYDNPELVNGE